MHLCDTSEGEAQWQQSCGIITRVTYISFRHMPSIGLVLACAKCGHGKHRACQRRSPAPTVHTPSLMGTALTTEPNCLWAPLHVAWVLDYLGSCPHTHAHTGVCQDSDHQPPLNLTQRKFSFQVHALTLLPSPHSPPPPPHLSAVLL